MPWFAPLVPDDLLMRIAVDRLLDALHVALVVFVMAGWAVRRLRRLHLWTLALVWLSWIALGLYVGNLGYCFLTDWQWQIKQTLGASLLPPSYLEYLYRQAGGGDVDDRTVSILAALGLLLATFMSLRANRRRKRGRA